MTRKALSAALALLLLLGLMAARPWLVPLPEPEPAQGTRFDTARAMQRLERILGDQRPHPVDSAANDAVRARLVAELRALGLQPSVTDGLSCSRPEKERTISCARVRNVVATIGPAAGKHVLLVAHYDSVPVGPGAADDGIGIAAMLETAALLRDRPLRRPVTFLFNEGEETGLLGARAFLERNPLASAVDTLINLESRGVTGPAIMFETSRPNGRAVSHYARAADRPVANSMTTDFYRLIPNSSDVAVFQERDWTILNFAVIGNETRYHSPDDVLAALDPRSLHHMGSQALALTEDFAVRGPTAAGRGSRLYADLLGRALVDFPAWIGVAALWLLLAGYAAAAWRRRDGLGRAAASVLAALAGAGLSVFLLQALVGLVRSGEWWRAHPHWIALGVDAAALAAAGAALLWIGRGNQRLRLAFWLVFVALGALLSLVAPGAAIFFLLPPALAMAAILARRGGTPLGLAAWALLFLSWAPLVHLSQVLLDFDAAWTFAPVSALLLLPVLIELLPLLRRLPPRAAGAALTAAALLAWLPAALAPAYSLDRKQRFTLEYLWHAGEGKARWLVYHDGAALPPGFDAAGPFERGVEVPWSAWKRWAAPAEGPAIPAPVLEPIGERRTAKGRLLSLRLRTNGADVVRLRAPPEAPLRAVRAGGLVRRFGGGKADEDYLFRCHGRSCDGLVVDLLLEGGAPLEATLIGTRTGLPAAAGPLIEARPATAHPQYAPDSTVVVKPVRL